MKKVLVGLLAITAVCAAGAAAGCKSGATLPSSVVNGGFETGDLSGWTVEYGDAYDNDSVSSRKTFSYSADIDPQGYVIPVNQTGNWYLSGRGFDNKRPSTCTGAIRSNTFVLGGDGTISLKLAGGATATARAETAPQKSKTEVCYLGVYRASDGKMIASQTNDYFAEDPSNIDIADYENGTCYTDNFCAYSIDLSEYIGEELYIRVVDNDRGYYYGYLSVDDIRIGKNAGPQSEGAYFAKSSDGKTAERESEYDIVNGGFESGNLSGWEVSEGRAFSDDGVNPDPYWWAEQIPYEREGNYHYGYYNPTATGRMRSVTFTVGGTGIVTYKLGGCADNGACYLRFMEENAGGDREILRVSNFAFKDMQFPNVQNGLRLINMTQYVVDFSDCLGKKMYIEVVDGNSSDNMAGCIVLDSVITYHKTKPVFTDFYEVERDKSENIPQNANQVINGGFESGNLSGWEMQGNIGEVTSESVWGQHNLTYARKGNFHFSGFKNEAGTGTLLSSAFIAGGAGWMTFRLGGAHDPRFCYVSLIDESDGGREVARYGNYLFHDAGPDRVGKGTNLANMVSYRADISRWTGHSLKIRITDTGTSNSCYITADSFITYYAENEVGRFPNDTYEAINMLDGGFNAPASEFQIENGGFETGDLSGWTRVGNIGDASYDYIWWNEWYTFNRRGNFHFSGFNGNEGDRGTLTSSPFTVGGSGMITYRLGGGKNSSLCYLEVVDENDPDKVYYRFTNEKFSSRGGVFTGYPIIAGCDGFGAKMTLYKADLSKILGRRVRLRLTDNATGDWGLLFADDFVTYYENAAGVPKEAVTANNFLPVPEFSATEAVINFAHTESGTLVLNPKNAIKNYVYKLSLAENVPCVSLSGNVLTLIPAQIPEGMDETYSVSVKAEITYEPTGEKRTQTFRVEIRAINDRRLISNGNFETGDLTGWTYTVAEGSSDFGRIEGADCYWNNPDNLFKKEGNYLFTGIETVAGTNQETGRGTLRSVNFVLQKDCWISFMLGGAHNANCGIRIRRASDDTILAEFNNLGKGRDGVLDRYKYKFDGMEEDTECYVEIFDEATGDWGLVVVDDVNTYCAQEPEGATLIENVKK